MMHTRSIGEGIPQDKEEDHKEGVFNRDENGKLKTLLGTLEKPMGADTCSLALLGVYPFSLAFSVLNTPFSFSWVIDPRATDHMTHSSHKFVTYNLCPSSKKIATVDYIDNNYWPRRCHKPVLYPKKCPPCSKIVH